MNRPLPASEESPTQTQSPVDSTADESDKVSETKERLVSVTVLPDTTPTRPEKVIPIRVERLVELLIKEFAVGSADAKLLGNFAELLSRWYHDRCFEQLHKLKQLYGPIDPDNEVGPIPGLSQLHRPGAEGRFLRVFRNCLLRANFRELELEAIQEAIRSPNEYGLNYVPDLALFEHLEVYVRGSVRVVRDYRSIGTFFRKRVVEHEAYRHLVVALKFKEGMEPDGYIRSDPMYLRMFKNVPRVDMEMHLPEQSTKIKMRLLDKAQIASPLMVGVPAVISKVIGVSSLYFLNPWLVGTVVFGAVSAGVKSFFGFRNATRKHLLGMIRHLYYLNLANNFSVITRLMDEVQEQETVEALLAYTFLWRGDPKAGVEPATPEGMTTGWTRDLLDRRIEDFLLRQCGYPINFEIGDALGKLMKLGLLGKQLKSAAHLQPIEKALAILDRSWDELFDYHEDDADVDAEADVDVDAKQQVDGAPLRD